MKKKYWFLSIVVFITIGLISILVNCGGGGGGGTANNQNTNNTTANTNTTSGGVGVVTTNGRTVAFIPGSIGLTPLIVDGTGAPSPALKAVGVSRAAGTNTTFQIDSCSVDVVDWKVVCVGYYDTKVAVFDISTYVISFDPAQISVTECDLNSSATHSIPQVTFSGGSCYNCGVATDPGDHRYVIASGDGFRVMNYNSCTPTASYSVPINENFSFDPTRNWILSPEYEIGDTFTKMDGTTMTEDMTFWLVNISSGVTYTWDKKMTCADIAPGLTVPAECHWVTTDSISIDPTTGIAVMGDEWDPALLFMDFSQASFNDTTRTFTAPHKMMKLANVHTIDNWLTTGTSIEPLTHILFMEEEFDNAVAVLQMPTAGGSGGTFPTDALPYNSMLIPDNTVCTGGTGTFYWSNVGDPHGLAIFTSQIDNKPYGLLVSEYKECVALVSLSDFLNASKEAGTNMISSSINIQGSGIVKFVRIPPTAAPGLKSAKVRQSQKH